MGTLVSINEARNHVDKLTVPAVSSFSGNFLNRVTIEKAIDMLGLKLPIYIKWSSGGKNGYGTYGTHRWSKKKNCHMITLSNYRDSNETSHTLWHELTHAAQSEKYGPTKFYREHYKPYGTTIGSNVYRTNPFEIEANAIADKYSESVPLCK